MTRVGIDAIEVERIKDLVSRYGERFLRRVYTPEEIRYAWSSRGERRFERLAGRFAAKEALIKAAGRFLPHAAIEVHHETTGRPLVRCALIEGRIEASLSHTRRLAVACVLLEETTSSGRPAST